MKTEKIINALYAVGAAIVIFGAWQKITHKPDAELFLTIGLLTEVGLFLIMGIQELFTRKELVQSIRETVRVDPTVLTQSIDQLTSTIKKVFNQK